MRDQLIQRSDCDIVFRFDDAIFSGPWWLRSEQKRWPSIGRDASIEETGKLIAARKLQKLNERSSTLKNSWLSHPCWQMLHAIQQQQFIINGRDHWNGRVTMFVLTLCTRLRCDVPGCTVYVYAATNKTSAPTLWLRTGAKYTTLAPYWQWKISVGSELKVGFIYSGQKKDAIREFPHSQRAEQWACGAIHGNIHVDCELKTVKRLAWQLTCVV